MKHWHVRAVHALAALLFAAAGAGCGGGGGGGGGSGAPAEGSPPAGNTPVPQTADASTSSAAAVILKSPATITDTINEGKAPHAITIELARTGDLPEGSALYVTVLTPQPLYAPGPEVWVAPDARRIDINLRRSIDIALPAGRAQGNLQVFACLDAACTQPLANSPITIPYDVEVRPVLLVSQDVVEVVTDYAHPVSSEVTVSAPQGLVVNPLGAIESSSSYVQQWTKTTPTGFRVEPWRWMSVGTYTATFQLSTAVPDPKFPDVPERITKTVAYSYTVTPGPPYLAEPESYSFAFSQSSPERASATVTPLVHVAFGDTVGIDRLRTDAYPAAAEGNPLLAHWLEGNRYFAVVRGCDTRGCLPVGTYRGALVFRYTATDGSVAEIEIPVTATIER